MALTIVRTTDERVVSRPVIEALEGAVRGGGSALLLVPSTPQVLSAQRTLAQDAALSLGVATATCADWVRDTWQTWGDGRTIADTCVLTVLAHEVLRAAPATESGRLRLLPGVVAVLARLVSQALPWLPTDEAGETDLDACARAGLTESETSFVRLAVREGRALADVGYVSPAEAACALPDVLGASGALPAGVVVAGFGRMRRSERELVRALARHVDVALVVRAFEGPAGAEADAFVRQMGPCACVVDAAAPEPIGRDPYLDGVLSSLFTERSCPAGTDAPVELLYAAGPVAEAELVCQRVVEIVRARPASQVVVVWSDLARAWRELLPKLEERHVSARISWEQPLSENADAVALVGFFRVVAHLRELADAWPEPRPGLEGPVPQLGDMGWWPPAELVDFLFSGMAHMEEAQVWALDASWRGNRLLTPARVLESLQSERLVSGAVARATFEICRGRIGAAAAKLLGPYGSPGSPERDSAAERAVSILEAVLKVTRTLRDLGVRHDPNDPSSCSLSELVDLMGWALGYGKVVSRVGVGPSSTRPQVSVMGPAEAARLEAASADVLVLTGMTSSEQPLEGREDVFAALLVKLKVEEEVDPLERARADFRALAGVAADALVLERTLADADGHDTYPSVMLTELMGAMGLPSTADAQDLPLQVRVRSEHELGANLSRRGVAAERVGASRPQAAGRLSPAERSLVFVPRAGASSLPDGLPVLSASQVECYLDCPYKWYATRRVGMSSPDAGFGPVESGSFVHRVLEATHRERLVAALRREEGAEALGDEELLARVAADPCRHVRGSELTADTLEEALATLELEFDLLGEEQWRARSPKARQQLLIPHDSEQRSQMERLRDDLRQTFAYETQILEGFEPRFFEWSFGRHGDLVPYAGAYFTGTVDRIDVSPHGTAVIIDYKHKSPSGFCAQYDALTDEVREGVCLPVRVQSLIYAQVVRRAFAGRLRLVGSVYLATRAPNALAGVADDEACEAVFGHVSDRRRPSVAVGAATDGGPGFGELLDTCEELIAEQVRQMLAGNVEARPRDHRSCEYCPVMQCERRVAR